MILYIVWLTIIRSLIKHWYESTLFTLVAVVPSTDGLAYGLEASHAICNLCVIVAGYISASFLQYYNNNFYSRAISKVLGEQWRELSIAERQEYATKAKVMADERRKINPDCWKRKRKKSKETEHEIDVDKLKMKAKKSPT